MQVFHIALKKNWSFRFQVFCGRYHKQDRFKPFWPWLLGPEPQPQEGNISPMFLVETRLKSESFEPLIGFLMFLVQTLWSKKLNLDKNNPRRFSFPNFGYFSITFEPEILESQALITQL